MANWKKRRSTGSINRPFSHRLSEEEDVLVHGELEQLVVDWDIRAEAQKDRRRDWQGASRVRSGRSCARSSTFMSPVSFNEKMRITGHFGVDNCTKPDCRTGDQTNLRAQQPYC